MHAPRPLLVFLTLVCFLSPALCAAEIFYVAPDGVDEEGAGTLENPFATIQYALYHGAGESDDVHVRAGVYAYDHGIWVENQGTADDPFTIQPYPGEKVVLDGVNVPQNKSIFSVGGQYVVIKGFEVRNSPNTGISIWGGSNNQILDNVIHDCWKGGIWVGGDTQMTVENNLVRGNTVYHNCQMNAEHVLQGGWPVGIGLGLSSRNSIVEQNIVYENHGEGIGCCCSRNHIVRDNIVYDNYSVGIYLDNAQDCIVERNLVYTTMNSNFFRDGYPFNGLQVANEDYEEVGDDDRSIRNTFRNNIVLGARYAFFYGAYQIGGGFIDSQVCNNTFHDPILGAFFIEADAHSGSTVANNILTQPDGGAMFSSGSDITGISFHHNLWHGAAPGIGSGQGDILDDPDLRNPDSIQAKGCKLLPGSPAIAAADAALSPADDHGQRSRDSQPDMGAWEFIAPDDLPALPWLLLLR